MNLYEVLGRKVVELEEALAENRQLVATLAKLKRGEMTLDNIRFESAGEPVSANSAVPEEDGSHGSNRKSDPQAAP